MKYYLTTALMLLPVLCTIAQKLDFRGEGIFTTLPEKLSQYQTLIKTAGGFVKIQSIDTTGAMQYQTRFENSGGNEPIMFPQEIFLKVGDEIKIEAFDTRRNESPQQYVLRRVKMLPEISIIKDSDRRNPLPLENRIVLPSGERISFHRDRIPEFGDAEIEFTLVNLENDKKDVFISQTEFRPRKMESHAAYELRYHYVVQPETVGVCRIEFAPNWYETIPTYLFFLVSFLALIIVLIFFVYRRRLTRSTNRQHELEQSSLRLQSQLNPHFTFNALSTVQGLMNTGRIPEANEYLQDFSDLLRKTLSKSNQVYNSLDQEIAMMQTYIKLEALRFNSSWTIDLDNSLDASAIEIPTLLLQPVIENAIRHGLAGLGERGMLDISVKKIDMNSFDIFIVDNGNWTTINVENGYGLSLTRDRIETLNRMKRDGKISLAFDNTKGTIARFTFTNWLNN